MNCHRNPTLNRVARAISGRPGVEKQMKLIEYGPLRRTIENSLYFDDLPAGGANWSLHTVIQDYTATARVVCNRDLDGFKDWSVNADIQFSVGFDEDANLYEKKMAVEFDKDNLTCDIVIPKCFPMWYADPIHYCFVTIETTEVEGLEDTRCYRFTGTLDEEKYEEFESFGFDGTRSEVRMDIGMIGSLGLEDYVGAQLEHRGNFEELAWLQENLEIFTKFHGSLSNNDVNEDNCERLLYISQFLEAPFARRACIHFLKRKTADVRKQFCWTREYGIHDEELKEESEDDLLKDTDIRIPKYLQLRELGAISGRIC